MGIQLESSGFCQGLGETKVNNSKVELLPLKAVEDNRGSLVVTDFSGAFPFQVNRFFAVFNVPTREIRGEHAHLECHQYLVCISGSCRVRTHDGSVWQEFKLDSPSSGLYLPPMTWGEQFEYSQDARLLVFASHTYSEGDYIRNFDTFLELAAEL